MNPLLAGRLMRGLLLFNGVMTLCALPAAFMPIAWMNSFHLQLGLGPLPEGPIIQYLARSVSGLYAAFGSLTIVLTWDVERYAPLVTWWGLIAILFGATLFWVDHVAGMPTFWKWGESLYLVITGGLLLLLQWAQRPQE